MELKYRAYQYSIMMIEYLDTLPNDISTSVITKQLLRSSTSIGANIIEAKGASSKRILLIFLQSPLNQPMKAYTG